MKFRDKLYRLSDVVVQNSQTLLLPLSFVAFTFSYQNCGNGFKPITEATFSSEGDNQPQAVEFYLSDSRTASTDFAGQNAISISLSGAIENKSFCLSETQINSPTAESCAGGAGPTNGWYDEVPQTLTLTTTEGLKRIYFWWKDENGVIAGGAYKEINLDLTNPTITIATPPTAFTRLQNLDLAFSATDGQSGVARSECRIDNQPFAACTNQISPRALTEGPHSFTVRTFDRAGHSFETTVTTLVDITLPTLTVSPSAPTVSIPQITFVLTANDAGSGINDSLNRCTIDNVTVACASRTFMTPALMNGNHTFTASVTDQAGNTRTLGTPITWTTNLDPTAVNLTIAATSVANGGASNLTTASFTFATNVAAPSYRCRVNPNTAFAPCTPGQNINYTALNDGTKTFMAEALNSAGVVIGATQVTWVVDTVRPVLTWIGRPSDPTAARSSVLTYSSNETVTASCTLDGAAIACANQTISTGTLADGRHNVAVNAVDQAGNAAVAINHSWAIDSTGPTIAFVSAPPALTNAQPLTYQFSANETVSFTCRQNLAGAFAACPNPYSYAVGEGSNILQVQAADALGNLSNVLTNSVTVDRTAPTITLATNPSTSLDTPTTNPNLQVSGSCSDASGIAGNVMICIKQTGGCTDADYTFAATCAGGTYTLNTVVNPGVYSVRARASDPLGQTGFSGQATHHLSGTLYFAEGIQSASEHADGRVQFFHSFTSFYQIANDNAQAVSFNVYFIDQNGSRITVPGTCGARSRCNVNSTGIYNGFYSAEIQPICSTSGCPRLFGHRSTYFKGHPDGYTGENFDAFFAEASHDDNAVTTLSRTHYFPEGGTTGWPTIYKFYNPSHETVTVNIRLYSLGVLAADPRNGATDFSGTHTLTIGPKRLVRLPLQSTTVMQQAAATHYKDFATVVESSLPIVAEQTLYQPTDAVPKLGVGGQSSVGAQTATVEWYFPNTENYDMQPRIYTFNPNPVPTELMIFYWHTQGTGLQVRGNTQRIVMQPFSRVNLDLYYDGPGIVAKSPNGPGDTGVSIKSVIPGTGDANTAAPIVVSKNLYWAPLLEGRGWVEGTQSFGQATLHRNWILPSVTSSGRNPGADNDQSFYHFIDVINATGVATTVSVTYYNSAGAAIAGPTMIINGFNRQRIRSHNFVGAGDFYAKVTATNPVSVESTTMFNWDNNNNYQWRSGETSPAIPAD